MIDETATTIRDGGNYDYTHKDFTTSYISKLHGIIAIIVLITTTTTTQNKIFYKIPFAIGNKYALDQVFYAEPVKSVYGFFQADYNLIVITHTQLKETQCIFKPIHIHPNQDKHKTRDKLTLVQQANTLAYMKIDEI